MQDISTETTGVNIPSQISKNFSYAILVDKDFNDTLKLRGSELNQAIAAIEEKISNPRYRLALWLALAYAKPQISADNLDLYYKQLVEKEQNLQCLQHYEVTGRKDLLQLLLKNKKVTQKLLKERQTYSYGYSATYGNLESLEFILNKIKGSQTLLQKIYYWFFPKQNPILFVVNQELEEAITNGHLNTIKFLLKKKAKAFNIFYSAFYYLFPQRNKAMLSFLESIRSSYMEQVLKRGHTDVADYFYDFNLEYDSTNLNALNDLKYTYELLAYIRAKDLSKVKQLIEYRQFYLQDPRLKKTLFELGDFYEITSKTDFDILECLIEKAQLCKVERLYKFAVRLLEYAIAQNDQSLISRAKDLLSKLSIKSDEINFHKSNSALKTLINSELEQLRSIPLIADVGFSRSQKSLHLWMLRNLLVTCSANDFNCETATFSALADDIILLLNSPGIDENLSEVRSCFGDLSSQEKDNLFKEFHSLLINAAGTNNLQLVKSLLQVARLLKINGMQELLTYNNYQVFNTEYYEPLNFLLSTLKDLSSDLFAAIPSAMLEKALIDADSRHDTAMIDLIFDSPAILNNISLNPSIINVIDSYIARKVDAMQAASNPYFINHSNFVVYLNILRWLTSRPLNLSSAQLLNSLLENDLLRTRMYNDEQIMMNLELLLMYSRLSLSQLREVRDSEGNISLRGLAQFGESSMLALSETEEAKLKDLYDAYPTSEAEVPGIIEEFKQLLLARYESKKATFTTGDGREIELPAKYAEWEALKTQFNPDTIKKALQAYYQHPEHTVWRYLQTPNSWIADNPEYYRKVYRTTDGSMVVINIEEATPSGATLIGKCAEFSEFQHMLAVLYKAAIDGTSPATQGYDLDTRLEQFIMNLAIMARVHNWDAKRPKRNAQGEIIGEEEFDDLKADNPACARGVRSRLYHALPGHRLMHIIGLEDIKEEVNQFVYKEFRRQLEKLSYQELSELKRKWGGVAALDIASNDEAFEKFNIDSTQIVMFINTLKEQNQDAFAKDPQLADYLENEAFKFTSIYPNHITKYGETFSGLLGSIIKHKEEANDTQLTSEEMREARIKALAQNGIYSSQDSSDNGQTIPPGERGVANLTSPNL